MLTRTTFARVLLMGCFLPGPSVTAQSQPTQDWSTYYGGSAADLCQSMTRDRWGNVYLTGYTASSTGIATPGAFHDSYVGTNDAFLVKISPSGQRLWATYYGGNGDDRGAGVACDSLGNVFISGYTKSDSSIATPGAHETTYLNTTGPNGSDRTWFFLAKFDSAGHRIWGTYYSGHNAGTEGPLVACDGANVYLAGHTPGSASNVATAGSHMPLPVSYTGTDGFLARFDGAGQRLWATYYGGAGTESVRALACDKAGRVCLLGHTTAASDSGIATPGAHAAQYAGGTSDIFLARFDSAGHRLWGTYYGGPLQDQARGLVCDTSSNIYITGSTFSLADIATPGAFQDVFAGGSGDGLLVKFDSTGQRLWGTYYGTSLLDNGAAVATDVLGNVYLAGMSTASSGLASPGAPKDTADGQDAYLAKFDGSGARSWATYFGGASNETAWALTTDHAGNVYLAGATNSASGLATPGGHQQQLGGGNDGFLVKYNDCPTPAMPGPLTVPAFLCRGASYTLHVPAQPGALGYTWTLPPGLSGVSTADSITVTVTGGPLTDTIRVAAHYLCGSGPQRQVAVHIAQPAAITTAGSLSFCQGDTVTLHANTDSVTSWQWLRNDTLVANGNDSSLSVWQAGRYRLIATTGGLCTDTSAADTVRVHPLPVPVITMSGNVLGTGLYAAYQWQHNGAPITGATAQTYTMPILSGSYSVLVTDTNGCTGVSAPYIPLDIKEQAPVRVTIHPNPTSGPLHITAPVPLTLELRTSDGRTLLQTTTTTATATTNTTTITPVTTNTTTTATTPTLPNTTTANTTTNPTATTTHANTVTLDLSPLPPGLYLLRIHDPRTRHTRTQKIIKQ